MTLVVRHLLLILLLVGCQQFTYTTSNGEIYGTSYKYRYVHPETQELDPLIPEKIEKELNRIDLIFSTYKENSEVLNTSIEEMNSWSKDLKYLYDLSLNLSEISKRFETKIILYFRRQDELIESLYIQSIKGGKTTLFNDFIKTLKYDSFNWSNYIKIWMQYFSKNQLIVRMYDKKKFKDGNIVTDFACVLDSKLLKNDTTFYEENKGYSQSSLEVAQMLNQYLNEFEKRYVRHLLEKIDTNKRHISSTFYTYKERQKVLAYFEKCNAELLDKFPFICSNEYFEIDVERNGPNSRYLEKSKDYDNVISNLISSLINENITLRYKTKPSLKNIYKMLVYYIRQ